MLSLDGDEEIVRPVGAHDPAGRRSFGPRQIVGILLVLALGGGFGTGAYFLSDFNTRDLIGFLDVGDPEGPALKLRIPGQGDEAAKAPSELLTPPKAAGGESAPTAPPGAETPPGSAKPATNANAGAKPVAETKPSPETAATATPGPGSAGPASPGAEVSAPPPAATAIMVPEQPTPRPAAKPPAYADLPARTDLRPLAAAPIKELQHESKGGTLPVVAADGRQAWKLYGRPFDAPAGTARVAVVVTDLGLDRAATEAAIGRLAPEVSLAFSPYAIDLPKWLKKARDAGHEVLIALPTEAPIGRGRDPGPLALLTALPPQDNVGRLETMLASMPVVVGVATGEAAFTTQPQAAPIMAALLQRGLLFVGAGAHGARSPAAAAISQVVDQDPYRDAIDARLEAGLAAAKAQGSAVLLASARPVTFERLTAWLAALPGKGAVAAPVSAVVAAPGKGGSGRS